jgi:hypothetical protein
MNYERGGGILTRRRGEAEEGKDEVARLSSLLKKSCGEFLTADYRRFSERISAKFVDL